ncbi:TraM recognition domain-containing protein [Spiroplasma endosymbiont of Nebria brevicollis]|uniref:TraM recognition domain-containing protein n=1 Tax=Spiroplasma endosymbiont of Nebria brevicollis TaxID=3066284 RepID=UPI00313A8CF9
MWYYWYYSFLIFDITSDSIINLINKTRSFHYQCFLCFQVTDDLSTDKKKILNTIFGNVGNIIAHKISDVENPEYIVKVFGTRTVEKITKQYDKKNRVCPVNCVTNKITIPN